MSFQLGSDLRQSDEQLLKLLIDAVNDYAIYMLDPNGVISTWNSGAQRLKGYTESEIIGQHFSRFYTEQDRRAGLPSLALATAAREGRFEQEGWRVRKDGTEIWAHVVIQVIRDRAGRLLGFAKITRDATERRMAEESLRRSEERFRMLVQGITDYAIYMLDPLGRVTNWNAGAQRFKGYTEAEIVGEHFSRFYTEEDRRTGLPAFALNTAMREGRFEQEGWRVRKDGTRIWAHVIIDAIRDDSGTLVGYAKVTRDVTEQRHAQIELEKTRATLLQSQKMETIGQLTGGIAHDFNNLLAVVLGNLELARKRLPEDLGITHLIDNSIQAAQRGASLTQRMLAFARRQELRTSPVDVPRLVGGMADLLQRAVGPAARISTQFPPQIAPALADENQLELALLNLAVNARDAVTEDGLIIIGAREEHLEGAGPVSLAPGPYVCISVTDAGSGMDQETLARAIEPFFTTKGIGKGTGLGLSMVHGFAEQSGGRLRISSAIGVGTTAEIWLPVAGQDDRRGFDGPLPTADLSPSLRQLTILVVDDDLLVLTNTSAMLADLGHLVHEADSAKDALRILRGTGEIDLVITDQIMPGMLGTQLIAEIRATAPAMAIILATGFADLPAGLDPVVTRLAKPFTQTDLARVVSEATRRETGRKRALDEPCKVWGEGHDDASRQ